jgi:hypothetical protein
LFYWLLATKESLRLQTIVSLRVSVNFLTFSLVAN